MHATKTVKRRLTWLEVTPMPGNPIYPKRVEQMRRAEGGYIPAIVGSPAIADNTALAFDDLPEDALLIVDGGHRRALAEAEGHLADEFLADLHRGLTREQIYRVRRGLNNRRTVKPAERFIELAHEGDRRKQAITKEVELTGWHVSYDRETFGVPCTNELEWIYDHSKAAMSQALLCYMAIWGPRPQKAQARVVKGLGAFWIRYPKADLERLIVTVRRAQISVDDLYIAGKGETRLPFVKSVFDGIRYVLAGTYNTGLRKGRLEMP